MRKHNDGYALVLVLVVMVVLCLVALALMSNSLRNLQSQQKSIERMEDKYAAEGAVEILIAKLGKITTIGVSTGSTAEEQAAAAVQGVCPTGVQVTAGTWTEYTDNAVETFTYVFDINSSSGTVQVDCTLEWAGTMVETESGEDKTYTLSNLDVTYLSYEISNTGGDEG